MTKGYWEKRYDILAECIYLIDAERNVAYTFELTAHKLTEGEVNPSTKINGAELVILNALAEALQMGGYIPKAATDAELKATKYHLEDLRTLALSKVMGEE